MRYNKIRKMDISNGEGVRVSVFFQGCSFHCKNCFNPETWDFESGKEFNDDVINHILDLCDNEYIVGLSILGGEPLHPFNIKGSTKIAKEFKKKFSDKNIWLLSWLLYENLKDKEIMKYIDVLVDGQYVDELNDPTLDYRGSSNQRVIDVKKSLKNNKIEIYKSDL